MLTIRKIIFCILSITYVVVCPLLIMYSLGYIYNPVKRQIVHTGMIRLVTFPPGADVFLERSRYKVRTPATISGVLVGDYRVTLKKAGYKAWSQIVEAEAGKAIAFESVLMIPDEWPTRRIAQTEYEELIPLGTGNRHPFIVAASEKLGSCYAYDRKGILLPLLAVDSPYSELVRARVHHGGKDDTLVVETGPREKKYLRLNVRNLPAVVEDVTASFTVTDDDIGTAGIETGSGDQLVLHWSRKDVWFEDASAQSTDGKVREGVFHDKTGKIRQCFPVYGASHVLVSAGDILCLLERMPQGQPRVSAVTRIKKGTEVLYDDDAGMVYYLEAGNGRLRELRILPSSIMLSEEKD